MKTFAYISSWTHGEADAGIGVYELDPETGTLSLIKKAEGAVSFNATFLDERLGLLYAMNEVDTLGDKLSSGGGRVFVFRVDRETGCLTKLGCTPTWCPNPCFMTLDGEKRYAVVSNHGGHSAVTKIVQDVHGAYHVCLERDDTCVELFALNEDGTLGTLLDVVRHEPGGRDGAPGRPHCAVMSPDGTLFAVCDKGNHTVRMYAIDRKRGKLYLKSAPQRYESAISPRYCVFHPTKPYFYHNNEQSLEFYAYRYDEDGRLALIQHCSTVPTWYKSGSTREEQQGLCIHPNGRFLYDVVRGPNVVCVFEIDEATGAVTKLQSLPVKDGWPRGCGITPDGRFLVVCGLEGGRAFVFSVGEDGRLTDTGHTAAQCAAAYVSFLQV